LFQRTKGNKKFTSVHSDIYSSIMPKTFSKQHIYYCHLQATGRKK